MATKNRLLLKAFYYALLLSLSIYASSGDFGDYADLTFLCPARTTCPLVCLPDVNSCPPSMTCPNGTTLCADGSCSEDNCNDDLLSPCQTIFPSAACAKVVDYYNVCLTEFQETYDYYFQYQEDYYEETTNLITFTEPIFIFFYTWIISISAIIVLWCACNERLLHVAGSTQPLQEDLLTDINTNSWSQTGYRSNILGATIHAFVWVTMLGFHVCLAVISVFYYAQQYVISWCPRVIEDEQQALICFIIVWTVGILWTFAIKWNESVSSLFLRRCTLENATYVAVVAPCTAAVPLKNTASGFLPTVFKLLRAVNNFCNEIMKLIFSSNNSQQEGWKTKYCRVYSEQGTRFFYYRLRRYYFDPDAGIFIPGVWRVQATGESFDVAKVGLTEIDIQERRLAVGPNTIHVKRPNFFKLMYLNFSTGRFYVYQFYILWSWVPMYYYYMAIPYFIIIISGGIIVSIFEYQNKSGLFEFSRVCGSVETLREGTYKSIQQQDLVPGDVVIIREGLCYCDMVLLEGSGLLVDESAQTGECTPVTKTAIDEQTRTEKYCPNKDKSQTILAGTTVIDCSHGNNLGLVINTGSFTSKGELVREMISYARHQFKFDIEIEFVFMILIVYGLILSIVSGFIFFPKSWVYGWFYGLYILSSVISALLPTVFVISVGVSAKRLLKKRITCLNSENILVAGKVKRAFFDKTGTLTKQGLEFLSAKSSEKKISSFKTTAADCLKLGMACCHTLVMKGDGKLVGHPLDRIMFEASGATMSSAPVKEQENGIVLVTTSDGEVVTILKHFHFDADRMTQSVIVQTQEGAVFALVKGSAESIAQICQADDLPNDLNASIVEGSKKGMYQILLAAKQLESDFSKLSRSEIESNLTFIGVITFKNMIREESPAVIKNIEDGGIIPIMVTGDSIFTGLCIARECNVIKSDRVLIAKDFDTVEGIKWVDESGNPTSAPAIENLKAGELHYDLAMMGFVWERILHDDNSYALALLDHVRVYGRCTPTNKTSIISTMISKGYITMMCGDGGNDCGALRMAHVGIALSDSEASMVSPFTSLEKNITSVIEVLREGRCALASAFATYKYIILVSKLPSMASLMHYDMLLH